MRKKSTAKAMAVCSAVVALGLAALAASPSSSPSFPNVLTRFYTGTYIEDITYVTRGPSAGRLAMVQGDGVYTIPLYAPNTRLQKLIDFRGVFSANPRGLAYIDDEHVFAMLNGASCDQLIIFDDAGRFVEQRPITHLNGYAPTYCESLAYTPATSPVYPGHLVIAANDVAGPERPRLEVMRTDGQVVKEVFPPGFVVGDIIGGVTFKSPDRLLIAAGITRPDANGELVDLGELWTLDFEGTLVEPPVPTPGAVVWVEGLVQVPGGRVVVTGDRSQLSMLDGSLRPIAGWHRDFEIGVNECAPIGIVWDAASGRLLVNATDMVWGAPRTVEAFSPSDGFSTASRVLTLDAISARSLTELPDEGRIGVSNNAVRLSGRRLYLFDVAGQLVEKLAFWKPDATAPERLSSVKYLPTTKEFAVRSWVDEGHVQIFRRDGWFVRAFDPRPAGVRRVLAATWFPDEGGADRLLVMMSDDQAAVTDLDGNVLSRFNWREKLGLIEPADVNYLSSGPYAGSFAVTEYSPGTVTIFSLDSLSNQ